MSWKDDLQNLTKQMEQMTHMLTVIQGQGVLNAKRIEALKVIFDSHVKGASRSADRMADRIVEMAMVNQGKADMATAHRRTLEETPVEGADLWQDSPETQWPPPGCDELRMP